MRARAAASDGAAEVPPPPSLASERVPLPSIASCATDRYAVARDVLLHDARSSHCDIESSSTREHRLRGGVGGGLREEAAPAVGVPPRRDLVGRDPRDEPLHGNPVDDVDLHDARFDLLLGIGGGGSRPRWRLHSP